MQEIEIEFKNLLTKHQYEQIRQDWIPNSQPKKQTNYYFETDEFYLKKHLMALRVREKGSKYVATLKQPSHEGLLETHDSLTAEEAKSWFNNHVNLKENIKSQLSHLNIDESHIKFMGSLTTFRLEKKVDGVVLVLDYSVYNGQEDYELEVEAPSYSQGEAFFHDILSQYTIKQAKAENKIQRFFNTMPKGL